jgi:hypothetical protein
MTSLRQQETKRNTQVDKLILQWKTPQNRSKVLLLVEGPQDKDFYIKFFDSQAVELRSSGGCNSMKDIYNGIQRNPVIFKYNLAICDSDFSRINRKLPFGENVFYADTHDHEMMCICCKKAFYAILSLVSLSSTDSDFETIVAELKELSLFKWFNYTYRYNCIFKHLELVNMPQVALSDYAYLHNVVGANSSKMSDECTLEALENFALEKECLIDWKEITNGHDFIKRFLGYCKRHSLGQFSEKKIRTVLHDKFTLEDFTETSLYSDIRTWENSNSKTILLN